MEEEKVKHGRYARLVGFKEDIKRLAERRESAKRLDKDLPTLLFLRDIRDDKRRVICFHYLHQVVYFVDHDFHPPLQGKAPRSRQRLYLPFLLIFCGLITLYLYFQLPDVEVTLAPEPMAMTEPAPPPPPQIRKEIIEGTINPGDTVSALLGNYFSAKEILALSRSSRDVFPFSRICAGQPYRLCLEDDILTRFEYDIDRDEQLIIHREGEEFAIDRLPIPYEVRVEKINGTITSSLFEAVTALGENDQLAMNLADIFAWDIDFILDIRSGDSFQVLVEKRTREGKEAGYGKILATTFTNQGETYSAYLFKDGEKPASYYDEKGKSVRKMFLKAPLSFSRISSGFTMKRFHPVTKTWKAHPAIDYAAPTGTPIKAVGDGTIITIGKSQYNGNHIKIRHNSTYQTLYLHMSRFAGSMKKGRKVRQGQIIGYVGSTGLATGPHLCFRMYKNGSPVNPTRVRAAAADPVSQKNLEAFMATIAPYSERLGQRDLQANLTPTAVTATSRDSVSPL